MVTQKRCLEILLHDHKNTFFDSFFFASGFLFVVALQNSEFHDIVQHKLAHVQQFRRISDIAKHF